MPLENTVLDKVSIIMPAYNEGKKICENLLKTVEILKSFISNFEIIMVNDGSDDNTLEQAIKAAKSCPNIRIINSEENHGKGNALRLGVQKAAGKYIAFLDADLDLHPSQLNKFFSLMKDKNADVVIGSKLHPDSETAYPKVRKIISFGYYMFLRILFRLKVRDTQTGMKLFKADVIKPVMNIILVKRFAYDIEVLSIINNKKQKIIEAPIKLEYTRENSWGRIKIKDIWCVLIDTLAIFYRLYILKYYSSSKVVKLSQASPELDFFDHKKDLYGKANIN